MKILRTSDFRIEGNREYTPIFVITPKTTNSFFFLILNDKPEYKYLPRGLLDKSAEKLT